MPFVSGMTVPKLNQGRLREIPIPVPSPEIQHQIINALDEAFEGLDRARGLIEANLCDARELTEEGMSALFRQVLGPLTRTTLGQIANFRNGLNYTRSSQGAEVKVVGVGDFKDNFEIPLSKISCVRIDGDLSDNDRLQPGDILAVRSNGNRALIGRTMFVPRSDEKISFSGFTIRIRLSVDEVVPEYLCSFLRTKDSRTALISGGGGTGISNLNQRLLSSFPVEFPSIDTQMDVLSRLEELQVSSNEMVGCYERALRDLDDLRQSLLQRAFAGELM